MPPISDLVRDSKLETKFYPGYTQHVYYVSGVTPRQRKVRKEERWERGKSLGTGAFGIVWLEKFVTENAEVAHRAVKEIRKTAQKPKATDYSRELEAIAKFSHPKYELCFVRSFGWYENSESVFIAMEYFPLGDLQNYLSSPLPEEEAQQITSQVLEGLAFMHDNGFAHRDLKPNNILVKSKGPDWWVKIGDFGISKRAEEGLTALRTLNGTPGFLAPEMLMQLGLLDDDGFEVSDEYTVAVDIWSLGEIAFRALTGGEQPFPIKSLKAYVKGNLDFPIQTLQARGVSSEGCDLLKNLMAPMPQNRLTARDALSHAWIEPQKPSSPRASAKIRRPNSMIQEETSSDEPIIEASACWSTVDAPTLKAGILMNSTPNDRKFAKPQSGKRPVDNSRDTENAGGGLILGEGTLENGGASLGTSKQTQTKSNDQEEFDPIAQGLAELAPTRRLTFRLSSNSYYGSAAPATSRIPTSSPTPVGAVSTMRPGEASTSESTSSSGREHTGTALLASQLSRTSSHIFAPSRSARIPSPVSKGGQSMLGQTDNILRRGRDEERRMSRRIERKNDHYEASHTSEEDENGPESTYLTRARAPATTVISEKALKSAPASNTQNQKHAFETMKESSNLPIVSRQHNQRRENLGQTTSQSPAAEVSDPSRSMKQELSFQEVSHQTKKKSMEHDRAWNIRPWLERVPSPYFPNTPSKLHPEAGVSSENSAVSTNGSQINIKRSGRVFGDYIVGGTIRVHELREDRWVQKKDGGEIVTITFISKMTRGNYSDLLSQINREVEILRKLHHPNLAHFYKMEETDKGFNIIFKSLPRGSLWDYIQEQKRLQENEAREFFAHLISGVGYLQKVGVVHHLIRPKNLLLDEHRRLIIHNFTLARTFNPNNKLPGDNDYFADWIMPEALHPKGGYRILQELMLERNGDSTYIAPEILGDLPYPGAKVDIWSCGMVLYEMLAGFLVRSGPARIQFAESLTYYSITSDARPLIQRLLVHDHQKRADIREIALHPWLSQYAHVLDIISDYAITTSSIEQFFTQHGNDPMPFGMAPVIYVDWRGVDLRPNPLHVLNI